MGYSRDTFYRYRQAVERGGFEALVEASQRKPNLRNRTAPEIEAAIVQMATDQPAYGQTRVANERRRRGMHISAAGVRCVWLRHDLHTMKKRLAALERKVAEEGVVPTETQVAAIEQQRIEDVAQGEIETEHRGYLGSQDTFYVGTFKGVGRIYQQTFIDTYSTVGFAELYTTKTALTAADLLNDRVLLFFESYGVTLCRILTDHGTEYCRRHDEHAYQLYLAVNDIDHTKMTVESPQTNEICERFHKTVLQEFYQVALRKELYSSLDEFQSDLDAWLVEYNEQRTHQRRMCCGRTPVDTFNDGIKMAMEKMIDQAA